MATVTHSTPADGTFSGDGATAWDADHTLVGVGDVVGPSSSIDNIFALYDSTTGKLIKESNFLGGFDIASPNDVTPVASMSVFNASYTNIDLVITPKGNGAFMLQIPDGDLAGGNKRGTYATDLQRARTLATQVASGSYAFAAGRSNTASGLNSIALGQSNTTTNQYSIGIGKFNTNSGNSAVCIGANNEATKTFAVVIGNQNSVTGTSSAALGYQVAISGSYGFGMGYRCVVSGSYSAAFGVYVDATASGSFVFGKGAGFSNHLINNVANSIWFAANSTVPSLAVWNAGGTGKYGKVSIGVATAPTDPVIFDVVSTTLASRPNPPMTTTQKNDIVSPGAGSLVYDTDTSRLNLYTSAWGALGDMFLADVQSVTGLKTFDTLKLAVKGSSTGTTAIASANAGASNYTATLQAATGTIAYQADVLTSSSITFVIDGGGSAITTGIKYDIEIPFACTINQATLVADQSGSIVIDLWKDTYANSPPTVADTITASAKPTLSAAQKSQDATLTGWTTSIAAGDIIRLNVDSASTVTWVTLSIKVTRA